LVVPTVVVGEAYTKLRYDRRVSPRNEAGPALNVFGLTSEAQNVFEVRAAGMEQHTRATQILTRYRGHSFSYVDAMVFVAADDDPRIDRVLTVDQRDFAAYRFAQQVVIDRP
jgi:predicted nucleic acid-binding protein